MDKWKLIARKEQEPPMRGRLMDKWKLIIVLLFGILLAVPLISAADWDNKLSYSNEDLKVTIKNSFLFIPTSTIMTSTLNTPQVYKVGVGYGLVAKFTINPYEDYSNVLGEFELYNAKNNKKINRQIDVKYLAYENVQVPDTYKTICSMSKNWTQECYNEPLTYKTEQIEVWLPFDNSIKTNEKVIIGLFTDVQVRDRVEWIPTIAGKKIQEWAEWVASSVNFVANATSNADLTAYNFTNVNFGAANNTRVILVGVSGSDNTKTVSSVSISGTTAAYINRTQTGAYTSEMWYANLSTGTSGYITITWSGAQDRSGIGVWALYDTTKVPYYSNGSAWNTGYSALLNIPDNGVAIGFSNTDKFTVAWTNLTTDFNSQNDEGGFKRTGASDEFVAGQTNYLVKVETEDSRDSMVVVSFSSLPLGLEITLVSPLNNTQHATNTINFSVNVSDTQLVGIKNVSLYIDGIINQTNTSTFEGIYNFSAVIPDGSHNWTVKAYGNDSIQYNATNGTLYFDINTKVTLRVIRSDTLELVSDGVMYIDGDYYNSNTKTYGEGSLQSMDGQVLEVRAFSLGGFYTENATNITISDTQQVYNITLDNFKLNLKFYRTNGTAINVSGYITDLNKSIVFSNVSYLKDQGDFQNDLIYIRFVKGIYNYSAYLTWENKSQFYEYDNSAPYSINENITIFNYIDTSSYFQTQDNAGNIIKGAVIRIYGVVPVNSTSGTSNYGFFGQRITDDNGRTVFPMDSDMEIYLVVTAKGYQTKTSRLTASEITTFTSSDPFIIRMQKSPYTTQANVFLGGLYKLEGTRVYESRFDNLSSDYYMFIYDVHLRPIKYGTSYEGVNYSVSLDGTTRSGVISLLSGQQFSSISNSTWYLYIWVNNSLAYNISMAYNNIPQEVILDIDLESLADSNAWRIVIFVGIILASMLAGLLFRTGEDDVGLHVFFVGGFLGTLAVNGLGWLALTGGIFYLGKIVKRFFNE